MHSMILRVANLTSRCALARSLLLRLDQFTLLVEEFSASLIVEIKATHGFLETSRVYLRLLKSCKRKD